MGNTLMCLPVKDLRGGIGSQSQKSSRSQTKKAKEEELRHLQALARALHSQRIQGSTTSPVGPLNAPSRSLSDPFSNGMQVPNFHENIKTKKIVLVHGEGFGAWCWYKTIALLEEAGLDPVALDLRGSGIDQMDPNSIANLGDYTKPLIDYLHSLRKDEKVILVGHSCGGASVSYALECYPTKISKAVFLDATMVLDGQRPFDVFAEKLGSAELFIKESQHLLYGNGRDRPPTGLMFDKQQTKALYFNRSPAKDIALAAASMRPIPLAPIMEKLSLTPEKYGTVQRFFIQALDNRMLLPDTQRRMVQENPPSGVYKIKGSDHCPFFSKPVSLNKILLGIARLL